MYIYTTQAKIEDYLERVLTAKEILRLPGVILAVGRDINLYTGREWQDINSEWAADTVYAIGVVVNLSGVIYVCTTNHTSGVTTRPGSGADWTDYWDLYVSETARYFDGNGHREMRVDDFISLSRIDFLDYYGDISASITDTTKFFVEPYNLSPKERVIVLDYTFPERERSVKMTGIWGSGVLPKDVEYIATALASSLLTDGGEAAEFKKESIEGYSYELNTSANYESVKKSMMASLDPYKRYDI